MSEAIHLDDLAAPQFSPEVEEIRGLMAAMASDCPLDSATLRRRASAETGLDDFGARDYEERLDVLLAAVRDIPGLNGVGVVNFHLQVLQLLKNRLLLADLLARHPEILDIELAPPVIIAGLPRTGTTHLHNLLAAGPAFRSLPYWESLEPIPAPGEYGVDPDPRLARTEQAVWFTNLAMPYFPLMHEMTVQHVHEEIQLLAIDFSTMLFETLGNIPAWQDYYCDHDQTPHYEFLLTMLKVLQHLRGGRRWLLKSPQHLEQLPVLASVFPDATVIVTHRDPSSVVVSMVTMIAYTSRMFTDTPDPVVTGQRWANRLDRMLTACVRDRSAIPDSQSLDVRFEEFMRDDLATARGVYEVAGEPLTPAAEQAMSDYLDGHERGRLGTIEYRAADVGLDLDELRERFAPYSARFL